MKYFVRVAAILVRDGSLLVHQAEERGLSYYALPGGHLEAGETTVACLEREFREEFGIAIAVGRLMYVAEGFFIGGRKKPKPRHEIVFYYLAEPIPADAPIRSLEEPKLVAAWLPLAQPLDRLFPPWLRELLPEDAARGLAGAFWAARHVVADERDDERRTFTVRELAGGTNE